MQNGAPPTRARIAAARAIRPNVHRIAHEVDVGGFARTSRSGRRMSQNAAPLVLPATVTARKYINHPMVPHSEQTSYSQRGGQLITGNRIVTAKVASNAAATYAPTLRNSIRC